MEKIDWEYFPDECDHSSTLGEWKCPYCGYVHKMDNTESIPDELEFETTYNCPFCGKTYILAQSVVFTHTTYKCK